MAVPLEVILRDLRTRSTAEVERIREDVREVVYSGATRIKALGQETEFDQAAGITLLDACNAILAPALPDPADPMAPNYADGNSSPNHFFQFHRMGTLCGP